jgi:hypothetical protein
MKKKRVGAIEENFLLLGERDIEVDSRNTSLIWSNDRDNTSIRE